MVLIVKPVMSFISFAMASPLTNNSWLVLEGAKAIIIGFSGEPSGLLASRFTSSIRGNTGVAVAAGAAGAAGFGAAVGVGGGVGAAHATITAEVAAIVNNTFDNLDMFNRLLFYLTCR